MHHCWYYCDFTSYTARTSSPETDTVKKTSPLQHTGVEMTHNPAVWRSGILTSIAWWSLKQPYACLLVSWLACYSLVLLIYIIYNIVSTLKCVPALCELFCTRHLYTSTEINWLIVTVWRFIYRILYISSRMSDLSIFTEWAIFHHVCVCVCVCVRACVCVRVCVCVCSIYKHAQQAGTITYTRNLPIPVDTQG